MTTITTRAVDILCRDERSGWADADTEGQSNIRKRYFGAITEFWGQDEEITSTPQKIADWYAGMFWTAEYGG